MFFCFFFFLMIRRPPRSTHTDTLFPYPTLFRSPPGRPAPRHPSTGGYSRARRVGGGGRTCTGSWDARLHGGGEAGNRAANGGGMRLTLRCHLQTPCDDVKRIDVVVERLTRSDERRVGKECVCTCRTRWSPYHSKITSISYTHTHQLTLDHSLIYLG